MKVYISADIEGITGVSHWDETHKCKPDFSAFAKQMTDEVSAACEGAYRAGAEEIWIKDAHESGRNIIASSLPVYTRLIRGWSNHPLSMVQELDKTFSAVLFVGFHSAAGSGGNPISHTLSPEFSKIMINGRKASEFLIHIYAAAMVGIPVVFISGDEEVCKEATDLNPDIQTVAVNKGIGDSVISIHPSEALIRIKEGVESALKRDLNIYQFSLPPYFKTELFFKNPALAYRASFYPGMRQVSPECVLFQSENYFEVLRMFLFALTP